MGERQRKRITVDGATYALARLGPMDSYKLLARGMRVLGPALMAMAKSGTLGELTAEFFSGDDETSDSKSKVASLLDEDADAIFPLIGQALGEVGTTIDEDGLLGLVELLFFDGKLVGHGSAGVELEVGGVAEYEDVLSKPLGRHGIMHQLKLLWEAVRLNLGPTSAGALTGPQKGGEAPA